MQTVCNRDVNSGPISRGPPLDAPGGAAGTDDGGPDNRAGVRIERPLDSALLSDADKIVTAFLRLLVMPIASLGLINIMIIIIIAHV